MSRITSTLAKRKALIAYLTVGHPSLDTTLETVPALARWGCDIVELGIPFSDPLADGATIQAASYQALRNKVTPQICLDIASQLRREVDIPLVFMSYYNPIFNYGTNAFCQASAGAGIDGLIIPDLPPEEGDELRTAAAASGLDLIYLLSPTSSEERIDLVASSSTGFIYIVSVAGVTGARQTLPEELEEFVARVRRRTTLPLCVGFGISTEEQAARVARIADGAIVGSRIIQLLDGHPSPELGRFVRGLRKALDTS
ncbi:MAG: tryptophan synthase subunit alpha [Chloroflexi bacterium]|nr:tryptophan synthase subunit alpha [Chloroflexota bacterium]